MSKMIKLFFSELFLIKVYASSAVISLRICVFVKESISVFDIHPHERSIVRNIPTISFFLFEPFIHL